MGLRSRKEGLSRFVLGCQGVLFLSSFAWFMHRRFHKDTIESYSATQETPDYSLFELFKNYLVYQIKKQLSKE